MVVEELINIGVDNMEINAQPRDLQYLHQNPQYE